MVNIYIATHKEVEIPELEGYQKIQVNAARTGHWSGCLHDDFGENISDKNPTYCELTALYSLWKNSSADIKGLVHYGRYFDRRSDLDNKYFNSLIGYGQLTDRYLQADQIERELKEYDLILPAKVCLYPLDSREDLRNYCYPGDIRIMLSVMEEKYHEYYPDLLKTMGSAENCYCNMMIAGKDIFDSYCTWLFSVLADIEHSVDLSGYDTQHQRIFGYLSEVLLNVYVRHNALRVKYYNMLTIDPACDAMNPMIRKMKPVARKFLQKTGMGSHPYQKLIRSRYWMESGRKSIFRREKDEMMQDYIRRMFFNCGCTVDRKIDHGFCICQAVVPFYRNNLVLLNYSFGQCEEPATEEQLKEAAERISGLEDEKEFGNLTVCRRIYLSEGLKTENYRNDIRILSAPGEER